MVIYIVDTYAWIEYFMGSESGLKLKNLFENKNNKFITIDCCAAELRGFCLRENIDFNKIYSTLKKNSILLPVSSSHWLEAAAIRHELRKKVKDFGLIDSILVAKQNELKCMIVSGDKHFKGFKNVVYIGD